MGNRFKFTGSRLALAAAASGAVLLGAQAAVAADAPSPQSGQPVQLGPLKVEGDSPNTLTRATGLGRLPGTVQDIPQTINVIPKEVMQQRNATTLDDALRNVAGLTVGVGEGGGSFNGDQFLIRGFTAKDDIYVDGLRDFGVYTRDAFDIEEVQVLKGPSSEIFGRGTTGGGINTISKKPTLDRFFSASGSVGSGDYYRGTADVNLPLTDTAAVRLNGMIHYQDVVDRDLVKADRWGFAPSLALGIGTDTTFDLNWLHQKDDRIPDYGVPVLTPPGQAMGEPVTENAGVKRSTFYGFTNDFDRSDVDMVTGKLSHKAASWLTLFNDTRVEFEDRKYSATRVSCGTGLPTGSPVSTPPLPNSCLARLYDGNPATSAPFTMGGAAVATGPYEMQAWGFQNIGTAVAEFHSFGLKNRATAGFDISYQRSDRNFYDFSPHRPDRDPFDPDHDVDYGIVRPTGTALVESFAEGTDYAVFASDQLWLTPEWSIAGGLRWDHFRNTFTSLAGNGAYASLKTNSEFLSPKASLIFQPTAQQTYYFSWARGATPQGTSVTNLPTPVSVTTGALDPEISENFEIGAKIGLFGNRLGVNAAVFQVTKDNAKEDDGLGNIISSGDRQRVRGFEIGVSGAVIERLIVTANYTFLDSETLQSFTGTAPTVTLNTAAIGKDIVNAPRNSVSLWASYEPIEHLSVGFGPTYRDKVYLNNTNTTTAPETISIDAAISYEIEHVRFALNGANLTDRLNYSGTQGGRVVPAAGRTIVFTIGLNF